ncbi:MAG: helix-turn-helix transcriptional regulator [Clostridia bacterium]|nr:helix-turn-helix transcriptional regulator [Clostridia bacterium]
MEFRLRFKELRLEKGVTQTEVANIVSMSKMAISHWEKGNSEPSIEQLKLLAKYFDVSVDYLIGNIE